ncbi:RNA polymerase II subunit A C-terminal domain phosphatase [Raphidocelis subcapitata]|uniref:RNA polymerase II subunit A C-terminal domain phosphatase SSU72 n=1 Tax=Raphidocelis subcapitata TaxID=307507 RepID=A0A2V0P282_9CHLO|nr:RNA polymerase II subunit A C-terminal domain phosphatase [Raphidocelis subcapitata]|eukprot:GBF91195.1 RNA polymerase II subunit A C-terminal domain phosphatase [Raphidocelis subcapitata]
MPRLRFAMVCASNMNRSMEAHSVLNKHRLLVRSYGVGQHVKLPGASKDSPNVYEFGTPYQSILDDLSAKDPALYARNGLLDMLRRNVAVKRAPERWQLEREHQFDVAVTFEERVMAALVEDMQTREATSMRPLLVVNIDVKDNHEEAARVAPQALWLCQKLDACECWEDSVDSIVLKFEKQHKRRATYTVCFY